MNFISQDNLLTVELDSSVFNETVLFNCLYWYTGKYFFETRLSQPNMWQVQFHLTDEQSSVEAVDRLKQKISQDLHDFKLREIVDSQTEVIRELIIAKAFSHLAPEADPVTKVSDPVGFNPTTIVNEP